MGVRAAAKSLDADAGAATVEADTLSGVESVLTRWSAVESRGAAREAYAAWLREPVEEDEQRDIDADLSGNKMTVKQDRTVGVLI